MTHPGVRRRADKLIRQRSKRAPVDLGTMIGPVPGQPSYSYVSTPGNDLPMIVYDVRSKKKSGGQVFLGRDDYNPHLYQVLAAKLSGASTDSDNPLVGLHASQHQWGGSDVVYIGTKQISELTVFAVGGLSVGINPGVVSTPDGYVYVAAQTVDLTSHLPANDVKFVTVSVDSDGEIAIDDGPIFGMDTFSFDKIPAPASGNFALAGIRLFAGQTAIQNGFTDPDIVDLRFTSRDGAGGGSIAVAHVLYTPSTGAFIVYPNSAAGLTSALAAAASSDQLLMGAGAYSGAFTAPAGLTIVGQGPLTTQILGQLTCGASCNLIDLEIIATQTGATDAICLQGPATGGMTLSRVALIATNSGTGNAYAIKLNGGYVEGRDGYLRASAADAGKAARIYYSAGAVTGCLLEFSVLASGGALGGAPAANWKIADGITLALGDCLYQTGYIPASGEISYLSGDRSAINHTHAQLHDALTVSDTTTVDLALSGQALSAAVIQAGLDHGSIGGLTDDDHTQYLLTNGGRTLTGNLSGNASADFRPLGDSAGLGLRNARWQTGITDHFNSGTYGNDKNSSGWGNWATNVGFSSPANLPSTGFQSLYYVGFNSGTNPKCFLPRSTAPTALSHLAATLTGTFFLVSDNSYFGVRIDNNYSGSVDNAIEYVLKLSSGSYKILYRSIAAGVTTETDIKTFNDVPRFVTLICSGGGTWYSGWDINCLWALDGPSFIAGRYAGTGLTWQPARIGIVAYLTGSVAIWNAALIDSCIFAV